MKKSNFKIKSNKLKYNKKIKISKNNPIALIERRKIRLLDEKFGIQNTPFGIILTFVQIFCTFVYTSLIQRFCFHVEDYPEIITGGFFWFKDLSIVEPYFILPVVQLGLSIMAIYVKITFLI